MAFLETLDLKLSTILSSYNINIWMELLPEPTKTSWWFSTSLLMLLMASNWRCQSGSFMLDVSVLYCLSGSSNYLSSVLSKYSLPFWSSWIYFLGVSYGCLEDLLMLMAGLIVSTFKSGMFNWCLVLVRLGSTNSTSSAFLARVVIFAGGSLSLIEKRLVFLCILRRPFLATSIDEFSFKSFRSSVSYYFLTSASLNLGILLSSSSVLLALLVSTLMVLYS